MNVPLGSASIREVDILGCFRYKNTVCKGIQKAVAVLKHANGDDLFLSTLQYPTCIELISSGRVDIKPLITHRFGFSQEDVLEGFDVASRPDQTGAIKVMFDL